MSAPARHRPHQGTWTVPVHAPHRPPAGLLDAVDRITARVWFSPAWWSVWAALFLVVSVIEGAR